jgi:acetyl esterase/lipase
MPLTPWHRLRTTGVLAVTAAVMHTLALAQTQAQPSATPAAAPAATPVATAAAPAMNPTPPAAGAARLGALLNFQRVLDQPDRPQPQHRVAYGTAAQQFGELWLPEADRFGLGPYPVALLVHGGCWMGELPGPELLAWQAEALRQRGFAVWSLSFRRVGHDGGGYPGTILDVARAADHLRELAKTHPLDLARVTVSGHSAGGHLAGAATVDAIAGR